MKDTSAASKASYETKRADRGNRERLLNAAVVTFAEQGFEGASLRAIASEAGVSFQLITHYFGNKEDLWRATVEHFFERYLETGKGLGFSDTGNIFEQFHSHLRLLLTNMLQEPELRRIWINEHLAKSQRYEQVIKKQIEQLFETLSKPYFEEVVRRGIVTHFEAWEIGFLFNSVMQCNVVYPHYLELLLGANAGSRKSIDKQVDFLFNLLTETPMMSRNGDDSRFRESALADKVRELQAENEKLTRLIKNLSLEKQALLDTLSSKTGAGSSND